LTDFDKIWQADVSIPSGPQQPIKFRDFKNSRWRRRPSWKFDKSQYLRNGMTDFDKVWSSDASGHSRYRQQINKNSRFQKSKMAAAAILKNRKILIYSQPIDQFWLNFACWCARPSLSQEPIKVHILKIRKVAISPHQNDRFWRMFGTMMRLGHQDTVSQ